MVNFKSSFSFDDSKLRQLQQKISELSGESQVPLTELMPDDFIRKHTDFQTLQAMINASGIENPEDIGNEKFSEFICTNTRFNTWEEMIELAGAEYVKRQLNL